MIRRNKIPTKCKLCLENIIVYALSTHEHTATNRHTQYSDMAMRNVFLDRAGIVGSFYRNVSVHRNCKPNGFEEYFMGSMVTTLITMCAQL